MDEQAGLDAANRRRSIYDKERWIYFYTGLGFGLVITLLSVALTIILYGRPLCV